MANQSRYIVEWTPTKEVERRCAKLGMKPGDDTSFWDWIEPDDCTREREFSRFDFALKFARKVLPLDCFGEVRITRQWEHVESDEFGRWTEWQSDEVWHVYPDEPVDETTPDYRAAA